MGRYPPRYGEQARAGPRVVSAAAAGVRFRDWAPGQRILLSDFIVVFFLILVFVLLVFFLLFLILVLGVALYLGVAGRTRRRG